MTELCRFESGQSERKNYSDGHAIGKTITSTASHPYEEELGAGMPF